MPGCESLEKIGEDEYRMKMKMALASLSGNFDGKVRITDQIAAEQFQADGGRLRKNRLHEGRRQL